MASSSAKLGLIAGNGRFPFLLLEAARAHGGGRGWGACAVFGGVCGEERAWGDSVGVL